MRLRSGHRVLAEPLTSPARSAAKSNDGFYTRRKHTRSITDYNMVELNEMSIDEIAEAMPKWADYHMVGTVLFVRDQGREAVAFLRGDGREHAAPGPCPNPVEHHR